MKINSISPLEHPYTQMVGNIAKVPKRLNYIGKLPDARMPTIAIVGTRKPSKYGVEVTEQFAHELARRGVVVVSGLALGVDALAHAAALDANGITLAVLPSGLASIYPATNRQLAEEIIKQGGALITEYDIDQTVAYRANFLERNRLVAGLADAILITEAAARSGTLNTAMHALEQGKEVFVIPGNITSPLSAGCNALLKQGATPVTAPEDILEVIAPNLLQQQTSLTLGANEQESAILQLLHDGIRDGEEIQRLTKMSAQELSMALTMLELSGSVRALGANQWTVR